MKKIEVQNLDFHYGRTHILKNMTLDIFEKEIFAIIGPANSGKTTFLKCLNRTIDFIPDTHVSGRIEMNGEDILTKKDTAKLRRKVGMVSPLPVGLPMTIRNNVTFAPRMAGIKNKTTLEELTVDCLTKAALWDEVKDRLDTLATRLSGGQQQRLTIARALSHQPEVLCLDEFSIAIDPVTTMRIEEVLDKLRHQMTIIFVTNMTHQARRLSNRTAMMLNGQMIEVSETSKMFESALNPLTRDYIEGRFG